MESFFLLSSFFFFLNQPTIHQLQIFHLILYDTEVAIYSKIIFKTPTLGSVSPVSEPLIDSIINTTVITRRKLGIMKLVLLTFYSSYLVLHLFLPSNFSSGITQLIFVHRQWYSNEKYQESPLWTAQLQSLLVIHINAATQSQ